MSEDWIESAQSDIAGALGVSVEEFASISSEDARRQLSERQKEKQRDYDSAEGRVNKRVASRALKSVNAVVEVSEKWFQYNETDQALREVLSFVEAGKTPRAKMSLRIVKDSAQALGGSIWDRFVALEEELSGPTPEEVHEEKEREREEQERQAKEAEKAQAELEAEQRMRIEAEVRERIERELQERHAQAEAERLESEKPVAEETGPPPLKIRDAMPEVGSVPEKRYEPCSRFSYALSAVERLHVLAYDGPVDSVTFGRYRSRNNPDLPLMNAVPKDKEETMQVIRMISGKHGSLIRKSNEWFLIDAWNPQDKPSTNGIYLDGKESVSIRLSRCNGRTITFSSPEMKIGLPAFKVIILDNPHQRSEYSILLQRLDTFQDHILILNNTVLLPDEFGSMSFERVGDGFRVDGSVAIERGGMSIAAFDAFEPCPFEEVFYQRG